MGLILLLTYFPVLLIGLKIWPILHKKPQVILNWNWKTILAESFLLITGWRSNIIWHLYCLIRI
jgi:hypothetical protein